VIGFYGTTDGGLLLSWMEILPTDGNNQAVQTENDSQPSTKAGASKQSIAKRGGRRSVVGSWYDGYASMLSGYTPVRGPKSYTPGRSSAYQYVFIRTARSSTRASCSRRSTTARPPGITKKAAIHDQRRSDHLFADEKPVASAQQLRPFEQ
jgi:hypothetical protein